MAAIITEIIKHNQVSKTVIAEIVVDTKTDLVPEGGADPAVIEDLPLGYELGFASRAICSDTLAVGVLDSTGTWHFSDD